MRIGSTHCYTRKMHSFVPATWSAAILLVIGISTVNGQVLDFNCPPELISPNIIGRVTSRAFTLQEYCCLAQYTGILPSDTVVTIVSLNNAINNFNPLTMDLSNPPLFSNFTNSGFFAANRATVSQLCSLPASQLAGLTIGNVLDCLRNGNLPYCNGPLFLDGSYRTRLLVYRNGTLIGITPWSEEILLRKPKDFRSIDTGIKHHSASMIVITSILPILFAVLLAFFTTLLFMSCCCCTTVFAPRKCQQES